MDIYFINSFIKNFFLILFTICIIYKNLNIGKNSCKNTLIIFLFTIIMAIGYVFIKKYSNILVASIVLIIFLCIFLKHLSENTITVTAVLTSLAICFLIYGVSATINYILWNNIYYENRTVQLFTIVICWALLINFSFRIKKFKNGFYFLYKKINNDFSEIIMINISMFVISIFCLIGAIINGIEDVKRNLIITFAILGIEMIIMIQKSFSMYYKQKLLQDNLTQYKQDLTEKDQEIQKLKAEKYSISKITHEFYNRQKALELAVKTNTKNTELINRIHNLTEEYSNELTNIKMPDKLQETGIPEIDDMFKYMQQECIENNIKFQLKIEGDIYYLINNIIPKNKLETLIGDHIRDAINAVSVESVENKEILVIMGIKENKYELCIYDTGVEFKKDTLLKLGLENVTTNKNRGGKGIGFITTFETLNETGGSLIIEEFAPDKDRIYTKAVKIRFDNKKEYRIISYRANKIIEENERIDIIIEDNLTF